MYDNKNGWSGEVWLPTIDPTTPITGSDGIRESYQGNRGETGGSESFGESSDDRTHTRGTIYHKVFYSSAYQNALRIFSADQVYGQIYIYQLEMILSNAIEPAEGFLSANNLSTKHDDKSNEIYLLCIQQIQALVQQYYQFKNSLPSTQVAQFNAAGINSAITGQGVNGSQFPQLSQPTANPGAYGSEDAVGAISSLAQFALSSVGGFADIVAKYKGLQLQGRSLDISEQSVLSQIDVNTEAVRKSLENSGITFNEFARDLASVGIRLSGKNWSEFDMSDIYHSDVFRTKQGDALYAFQTMMDNKYPYLNARGWTLYDKNNNGAWSADPVNSNLVQLGQVQYDLYILNRVNAMFTDYYRGVGDMNYQQFGREVELMLLQGSKTLQDANIKLQPIIQKQVKADIAYKNASAYQATEQGNLAGEQAATQEVIRETQEIQKAMLEVQKTQQGVYDFYIQTLHRNAQNGDNESAIMLMRALGGVTIPYESGTTSMMPMGMGGSFTGFTIPSIVNE